jgi:hypothetical protein
MGLKSGVHNTKLTSRKLFRQKTVKVKRPRTGKNCPFYQTPCNTMRHHDATIDIRHQHLLQENRGG